MKNQKLEFPRLLIFCLMYFMDNQTSFQKAPNEYRYNLGAASSYRIFSNIEVFLFLVHL